MEFLLPRLPRDDLRAHALGGHPYKVVHYVRSAEGVFLPELPEAARRKGTGGGVCGNRTYKGHIKQMFF